MIKKLFISIIITLIFIVPTQAQFKNLGKVFEKAIDSTVDKVTKKATDMTTDAALELGANKASDQIIKFIDTNNKVVGSNSKYTTRLNSILGDNFQKVENKTLVIKIYDTTEANVITLNNGNIRIYSGMMDILTDEELKALIALQVGHIRTGNVKTNLLKAISGDDIDNMTESQLDKVLSFSGDKIKNILNEITQLPYNREQNKAADNYAKKYLKNNGGSDKEYSQFISKIKTLSLVDLDSNSIDTSDKDVKQASIASSFIKVNCKR